ncbi:hypothetical protein PMIT1318_00865 [Prochlorococcus marinus str. MIT 1318]|nr:hypothetical protein PMIT1318_00865 [Prochlorococcus marinus str. MIT 1318]
MLQEILEAQDSRPDKKFDTCIFYQHPAQRMNTFFKFINRTNQLSITFTIDFTTQSQVS